MRRSVVRCAIVVALTAPCACGFDPPGGTGDDGSAGDACTSGPDFDGDGVSDACDPCPHLAAMNADADGDRVGDACDPNPQSATETRVAFETFDTAPTSWIMVGEWTFDGGVASHASDSAELDYLSYPEVLPRAYAATRIRVGGFTNDHGSLPSLGVSTGGIPPKQRYYSCAAGRYFFTEVVYAASEWGDGERFDSREWPEEEFSTIELAQWTSAETSHCFGRGTGGERGASTSSGLTEGRVSLYSIDGRGEFEYLFIVRID